MHTWHDKSIQSNKYVYILQKCKTTRTFVKNLFMGDVTLNDADKDQSNLLFEIVKCWVLIALATVKAGNTSEGLLLEIIHIVCSFYQAKEITKKVCNNIIKSI